MGSWSDSKVAAYLLLYSSTLQSIPCLPWSQSVRVHRFIIGFSSSEGAEKKYTVLEEKDDPSAKWFPSQYMLDEPC